MELDITASRVEESTGKLLLLGHRATDARPLWRNIAPVLLDGERRLFQRGFTKKTSKAVAILIRRPRTGKTVRQRRSRRRWSLVDSGRLRRSLTKRTLVNVAGADTIMDPSDGELRFGTSVFYARFLLKRGFNLITLDRVGWAEINEKTLEFLKGDL